jgi:very-short-patch-repair endonuclease
VIQNLTPQDRDKRLNSPPLQGRGRGWGVSAGKLEQLHARAAEMRRNPTEPEKRVWRILSGSQLNGYKFRRQSVIGYFIADFMCPAASLIVEVDGDTHDEAKDRLRDDILGEHGFRVIRVTNHDVMTNIEGVWRFIAGTLLEASNSAPAPHPNPVGLLVQSGGLDWPTPEGEGLKKAQKLLGISLEGSVG